MTLVQFVRKEANTVIENLDEQVTLQGLLNAIAAFAELILEKSKLNIQKDRELLQFLIIQIKTADIEAGLRQEKTSEKEHLLRSKTLNADAATLYEADNLTYRELLRLNPEAFLPKYLQGA